MLIDSTLSFDPPETAVTDSRVSINVLDLGANPTAPYAATVIFSAAFAGSNGTSLRIQVEGSIDNSTWFAIAASPALPISTINRMSQEKYRFNLPIEIPVGSPTPRYYRLSYTVNAGPFTTGAVNSFLHQNRDQPTGYLFPKTNLTGQDGLSGPDGAGMVGFDALTGEYPAATIGSQLRTRMTVDGLKIGVEQDDVVAVENRAKIQEYIDYAGANGGGNIYLPAGIIKVQPGLKLLPSTHVWGQGVDEFERIEHGQFGFERGTTLLLTSSPADTIQIDGITNMSPYGGIVPNPDHRGAGFNDDYSLFDFTNADATATTPATLKNISYGFLLNKAHNAGVHNLRIAPEFNGISGYYDTSLLALGNDVDVGILNLNSKFVYCSDFQCFGNWRVAGLGVFLSNMAPDIDNAITFGLYERAQISGYRCIMVRATDIQRVLEAVMDLRVGNDQAAGHECSQALPL